MDLDTAERLNSAESRVSCTRVNNDRERRHLEVPLIRPENIAIQRIIALVESASEAQLVCSCYLREETAISVTPWQKMQYKSEQMWAPGAKPAAPPHAIVLRHLLEKPRFGKCRASAFRRAIHAVLGPPGPPRAGRTD
jgi:hypothetical protein